MPTGNYDHPLFGHLEFRTLKSTWTFGGEITFTKGFDPSDVTKLLIPQLVGIPSDNAGGGRKDGKYLIHKRAHAQFLAVFSDLETLGLMRHVKTCAGSFYMRLKKPTSGKLSKSPSNHSFGIAIDLNSDDGSLGGSVSPVAPTFEKHGFKWGKSFNDPMHFEVETFVDHPKPSAQAVTVKRGGVAVDLGAMNLGGHVMLDLAKASRVFSFVRVSSGGGFVRCKCGSKEASLRVTVVGGTEYVFLTMTSALAGLVVEGWDNVTKTATIG